VTSRNFIRAPPGRWLWRRSSTIARPLIALKEADVNTSATNPFAAGAALFVIDPAHTNVEFAVRHLMISTVKGSFKDVQGTVRIDGSDTTRTAVTVTINPASIDTREPQRDAHLKSPDFLDVDRVPAITFQSRRVDGQPDRPFKLVGDLTIRGVTREVVLDVVPEGRGVDPWGHERAGFSATARISRGDFGLTYNQVLEAGGVLIGDEVKISIDVELVKQAAPSAA
jgi:polyisoprenoid-binding protein YceI